MADATAELSGLIRDKAADLKFDLCGIARVRILSENEPVLRAWCEAGMNAGMNYLNRKIENRLNPESLLPGAKSMIVTGFSYYTDNKQKVQGVPVLSRYAYGINYHDVISARLEQLLSYIRSVNSEAEGRIVVDSAPLLEKGWAIEAGLGWRGKHSVIINRSIGSFFFIGILILNIELIYDRPSGKDYCGNCRQCIDLCPTGAINNNRTIDARKCIANLTIENRGPIPEEIIPKLGGRVYGCDRCQEVCPWNKNITPHSHPEFDFPEEIAEMTPDDWQSLTEEQFTRLFRQRALERISYPDMVRNINAAIKSLQFFNFPQ